MFGLSNGYLLLIVVTLAIGGLATWYVNSQLKKYTHVPISTGLTGAEAARRMLMYYGIGDVEVHRGGPGQDFFDPRTNSVTLSPDAYAGRSITATATACHEVGHACQYAQGYAPMKIRGALVPVVNLASNAWIFLLIQLVTLPVEFNASQRAMAYMNTTGLPQAEQAGSFNVLRACALTYVAAALTSILQLLWLLGQRRD